MSFNVTNRPKRLNSHPSYSMNGSYSKSQFRSASVTATRYSSPTFYTPCIKGLTTLHNKLYYILIIFCLLWLFIVFGCTSFNPHPLSSDALASSSDMHFGMTKSPSSKVEGKKKEEGETLSSRLVINRSDYTPGQLHDRVKKTTNKFSNGKCPTGFKAMTYASHGGRDDRFCRTLESAIRNDIPLEVLGWGVPWEGLSQKLSASYDAVKELPDDCLVMFTDGFDILFTDTSENIIKEFNQLNVPLLFSGECGCWPQLQRGIDVCLRKYPESPTLYRFLNSGSWMGKAKNAEILLKEVMEDAINSIENSSVKPNHKNIRRKLSPNSDGLGKNARAGVAPSSSEDVVSTLAHSSSTSTMKEKLKRVHNLNDQELISDFYMEGRGNITLDHFARIFQSVHSTDAPLPSCKPRADLEVVSGPHGVGYWYNKYTKSYPKVIHFNGGGKKHHLEMESKIWYRNRENINLNSVTADINDEGTEKVRKTKLLFNNRYREFQEICPISKYSP